MLWKCLAGICWPRVDELSPSSKNLKKTFKPWDFILPTLCFSFFFFKNAFFCKEFQCWPFLCYFCQIKLHWGRFRVDLSSNMIVLWAVHWHQDFCVFMSSVKGTFGEIFVFAVFSRVTWEGVYRPKAAADYIFLPTLKHVRCFGSKLNIFIHLMNRKFVCTCFNDWLII